MKKQSFEVLRDAVVKHLIEKNITITCMESCTSGLVASMITDTAGASAIFKGSLVTYANETKISAGVDPAVIAGYGVYSQETAREMAKVVQKIYDTDIAIGVTGSTGNVDPNNSDSVVGEVHYAIILRNEICSFTFRPDVSELTRKEIKQVYAEEVFSTLLKLLLIN